MSRTVFTTITFGVLFLASSVFTGPVPDNSSITTTASEQPMNINQPVLPGLVSNYILQPIVDFNNLIAAAANSTPEQLGAIGQSLGSSFAVPIQYTTNTSNNLVSQFNSSLVSVSNAVHPILIRPLAWMINSTLGGMTLNALNYTSTGVGGKISTVGSGISYVGDSVQSAGNSFLDFVAAVDAALRQLNNATVASVGTTPVTAQPETVDPRTENSTTTTEVPITIPAIISLAPATTTEAPTVTTPTAVTMVPSTEASTTTRAPITIPAIISLAPVTVTTKSPATTKDSNNPIPKVTTNPSPLFPLH